MQMSELQRACEQFAQVTAPYLNITNSSHYEEALSLVESLMESTGESETCPMNAVIEMIGQAIETYENEDEQLHDFEQRAMQTNSDTALLRVLMDQHQLNTTDLPEIGSKSMVSRVLSGERELSKKHIIALSDRFGIDPGLFFR